MSSSLRFVRCALLVLALGLVGLPMASPASATLSKLCNGYSGCASVGRSNAGYQAVSRTMWWRMYGGHNCTNYVAYRMVKNGMSRTRPWTGSGNATNWGVANRSITDSAPAVGAVAWWRAYARPAGSVGHVAYVEQVISANEIIVSQDSWGGDFSWARIKRTGGSWPSGFVHFKDATLRAVKTPTVTGTAKVGQRLTATAGSWSPAPSSTLYQWLADGKAIPGALGSTLDVQTAQVGKQITVRVTAAKPGYRNLAATSARTAAVAPAAISSLDRPAVSGTARVGAPLAAAAGSWSPAPDRLSYRWSAGGVAIPGATSATYTPTAAQQGKALTVAVTAAKAGYPSKTVTSTATRAVALGALVNRSRPRFEVPAQVDRPLTAAPGDWSPTPQQLTYAWSADGTAIPGADRATFTPDPSYAGKRLSVAVTASLPGYQTQTVTTAAPVAVQQGRLEVTRAARLEGSARLGSTLTLTPQVVRQQGTTTRVQWTRAGLPLSNRTARLLRRSDIGQRVTVTTTVSKPGYATLRTTTVSPVVGRSVPSLRVTGAPGRGTARLSMSLTAPGTTTVGGRVRVTWRGRTVAETTMRRNHGSVTVTGLRRGDRSLVVHYLGTSWVAPTDVRSVVRVR